MKFASIGSGSSGNCSVICSEGSTILVDCGFGIRETNRRLDAFGIDLSQVDAVLVTHEHSDHCKGVGAIARKYGMPVYMTRGTHMSRDFGQIPKLELINCYQSFNVGQLKIQPVAVPHDAREPAQFIFEVGQLKLGILTDLGEVTQHVVEAYHGCHGLLVEANHDLDMLARGPYPEFLKLRVGSRWGHLNNFQTCDFLSRVDVSNLQTLVVGHISEKNNSIDRVHEAMAPLEHLKELMVFACQDKGFDWFQLKEEPVAQAKEA